MKGLTVGRMVHYVNEEREHLAGMVVWVWGDELVNICVHNPGNGRYPEAASSWVETSVEFDGSEKPKTHSWHWIEPV